MNARPSPSLAAALLPLLLAMGFSPPLGAQGAPVPVQVLVLGTYHFANPGLDVVKFEVDDVLAPDRQAEIVAISEALVAFRPTRVAVEVVRDAQAQLDSLYGAYRADAHQLTRDETQQIGFRLAHAMDHPGLIAFDHRGEFPFGPMMEHAQRNDPTFVARVGAEMQRVVDATHRRQRELTIGGILREMNDPANLSRDHGLYMRFAAVGTEDGYPGAILLSRWYERNLHMFANLAGAARPGDRIVVIVGAGHAPTLRQFIADHPEMELVDLLAYLPTD